MFCELAGVTVYNKNTRVEIVDHKILSTTAIIVAISLRSLGSTTASVDNRSGHYSLHGSTPRRSTRQVNAPSNHCAACEDSLLPHGRLITLFNLYSNDRHTLIELIMCLYVDVYVDALNSQSQCHLPSFVLSFSLSRSFSFVVFSHFSRCVQ